MENLKNKEIFNLGQISEMDEIKNVYLPEDDFSKNATHLILSPIGKGKTTFMNNLILNAVENKEANIVLSNNNSNLINKLSEYKDVIIIDIKNIDLLSFSFNEFNLDDNENTPYNIYSSITKKAKVSEILLDSISDISLTTYESCLITNACKIVYSIQNKNFKDLINFLLDYKFRNELIDEVSKIDFNDNVLNLQISEAIDFVSRINEYRMERDKDGIRHEVIIGTNFNKINSLYNKIVKIKQSYLLSKMIYSTNSMNFKELIEDNKTIIINLSEEDIFKYEKDFIHSLVLIKSIFSKISINKKLVNTNRLNIFIEEINQTPNTQNILANYLSRSRMLGIRLNLSLNSINQINNRILKRELIELTKQISLLQGCTEIQFKDFKQYLKNYNIDDIYNLKPYTALHLIKTNNGINEIITTLPKPF